MFLFVSFYFLFCLFLYAFSFFLVAFHVFRVFLSYLNLFSLSIPFHYSFHSSIYSIFINFCLFSSLLLSHFVLCGNALYYPLLLINLNLIYSVSFSLIVFPCLFWVIFQVLGYFSSNPMFSLFLQLPEKRAYKPKWTINFSIFFFKMDFFIKF